MYQLQLVSPSLLCVILLLVLWQGLSTCHSFWFLRFSLCGVLRWQSALFDMFSLFLVITMSSLLDGIRWSVCISISQRILCVSFFRTDFGLCIYHFVVGSNFNFLHISQLITSPPSRIQSYSPFALVCDIHLLCDYWFRLYHHIIYIYYSLVCYQFSF